ncbi:LysR family transcriptional regulator [Horticoccus luteus]|uniref:LysR family transcriptional regulator n=1 Tax=Horticoccus luteus TaxID=2862869 RepID=A0A8F9XG85_9BACT|nr:LysR family transcriptional regulator [Horticoccus luteus]QYM78892.1 LysR family transcriptional regulator [Horticoccus luteus]
MNEFLTTAPFDIYELHLFHLVAQHRSFTRAAEVAGLTQSAVTRQVQGIEASLGLTLFERTTRTVTLTPAGEALWRESARLVGDVAQTLKSLREEFTDAKKEIRVGVSRSVGLAYLPGFFHANLRRLPHVGYRVAAQSSAEIHAGLEANELDVGVLSPPHRLPQTVRITHRFTDTFALVGSPAAAADFEAHAATRARRLAWLNRQNWLVLDERSNTGRRLHAWMTRQGCRVPPGMQLDNFDLIINLAALGMGVSFVPVRALALYGRKRSLRRLPWPERFERELVVLVRRHRKLPPHILQFIDNVLF